ncbi:hypothetical protein TNCV_1431361 [Trichonephila clavipes]|nr:hypothetical protein TNCV_1431361 [Trichonephila clavipes]
MKNSPLEGPPLDRKEFFAFSRSSWHKSLPRSLSPDERCTRVLMAQFPSPLWTHTGGHMRFDPFDCLVIKVMDLWQTCHEFKPGTTEDPRCRGGPTHAKYVEPQTSSHWCGMAQQLMRAKAYCVHLSIRHLDSEVHERMFRPGVQQAYQSTEGIIFECKSESVSMLKM